MWHIHKGSVYGFDMDSAYEKRFSGAKIVALMRYGCEKHEAERVELGVSDITIQRASAHV